MLAMWSKRGSIVRAGRKWALRACTNFISVAGATHFGTGLSALARIRGNSLARPAHGNSKSASKNTRYNINAHPHLTGLIKPTGVNFSVYADGTQNSPAACILEGFKEPKMRPAGLLKGDGAGDANRTHVCSLG